MPHKLFPARKTWATRKQVAAGVRPIRLAELEELDHGRFDPDALFAVMRVLHLRPGMAIEGVRS